MTLLIPVNKTVLPDTCKKRRIIYIGVVNFAVNRLGTGGDAKQFLALGHKVKPEEK